MDRLNQDSELGLLRQAPAPRAVTHLPCLCRSCLVLSLSTRGTRLPLSRAQKATYSQCREKPEKFTTTARIQPQRAFSLFQLTTKGTLKMASSAAIQLSLQCQFGRPGWAAYKMPLALTLSPFSYSHPSPGLAPPLQSKLNIAS